MADIGPSGEDQGKGGKCGKCLLLPPDSKGDPPAGFFPLRYPTYNGYALYRAIRNGTTDADAAAALALVKKLRVYPLAQATNPPEQRFIDIYGKTFDGIANFDVSFFESLNRMVQEEPVLPRDVTIMGMLKSTGIEKGKDFKPDAATQTAVRQDVEAAEHRTGFGAMIGHQDFANKQLEASPYQCTQLDLIRWPAGGLTCSGGIFLVSWGGAAVAWPHAKQAQDGLE
jgi:hypothetical protein